MYLKEGDSYELAVNQMSFRGEAVAVREPWVTLWPEGGGRPVVINAEDITECKKIASPDAEQGGNHASTPNDQEPVNGGV